MELPSADEAATEALVARAKEALDPSLDPFEAWRSLAPSLGAHVVDGSDEGEATFGFFAPHLAELGVSPGDVFIELLVPTRALKLDVAEERLTVRRVLLPARCVGDTYWAAGRGCVGGTKERVGTLYTLRFRDPRGEWQIYRDPLAVSLPFGAFAPAELYDVEQMHRARGDVDWFREACAAVESEEDVPRLGPPLNVLEVHVGTATAGGTIRSLDLYLQRVAERVRNGAELPPADKCWLGYDAVQLMPVHATVRDMMAAPCWEESEAEGLEEGEIEVVARRPWIINWGYDVVISGCGAPNASMLATRRPDEIVDLSKTLHSFPGRPIRLFFDLVFGHADNQGVDLLPSQFFLGPNMYGQDLNYRHPAVRAILLEMQRRLVDLGADGIRVDGAQDFKWWNAATDELLHDDAFLREMSALVQRAGDVRYRPFFIFEDGRPWPREDWELASTYTEVIEDQPHVWQWGPLTFAHNTPFLYTFWISKWWRIKEILDHGGQWISGVANHDTLRRGTQVSPKLNINRRLGSTLLEIIDHAYDHAAANLLFYGFLPGTPMDFLNSSMRAAWGFMRNTDDRYAVRVAAQEASFLEWQVDEISFGKVGRFRRLKALGFEKLADLRGFMSVLAAAADATEDEEAVAAIVRQVSRRIPGAPDDVQVPELKEIARAFMDDMHDDCNVANHVSELDPTRVDFNLAVRRFRAERPWIGASLREGDHLGRRDPARGTVLFSGLRRAPDESEEVLFVANMEGAPVEIVPSALPVPGAAGGGWSLAVASPRLEVADLDEKLTLEDAEGMLLTRRLK